uniref:Major extracellular endoglucanase (Endo-1,4-beta-glucanase) (Cellulase) n=1 Tax=mine drainage metagenome TaxID=410659 RepID=E6QJA9_9ZZZZ
MERKKQSPTYQPTPTPTPTPLSLADLKELFDNLRNQG